MKQTDSAFEQWYNGMVGFHINSERILEDLFCFDSSPEEKAEMLRKWMAVCWNTAIDAVVQDCDYVSFDPEKLKEKI